MMKTPETGVFLFNLLTLRAFTKKLMSLRAAFLILAAKQSPVRQGDCFGQGARASSQRHTYTA